MGISISELKSSMAITYNDELYMILDCEHSKIARGSAFCRVRLKNLKTSQIRECTLRNSDNIKKAFIAKRELQYSYTEGEYYHFLDLETYDDLILQKLHLTDKIGWLKDNLNLVGLFYNKELLELELPLSIELKVIETDPGFRGDTVKIGTKPAKLETGLMINVPLFVNNGDIIKVNTRNKEYLGRA